MPYYKFGKNDLFRNVITTFPEVKFHIYGTKVYYQNQNQFLVNSNNPTGYANLYELNVNRIAGNLIYPYIPKTANLTTWKTVTTKSFSDTTYGTDVIGSYPMTASISTFFPGWGLTDQTNLTGALYLQALKNTLNFKTVLSDQYAYSASYGNYTWDKDINQ